MDEMRVGLGFDSHRIELGGLMMLGGVAIDCGFHFVGHSDADVLLHAITDAILGGAGLEDIGTLFPNNDPKNKNRDSAEMLSLAWEKVRSLGFRIVNLDCVVQTEVPKVQPFRGEMRKRIAQLLGLEVDAVGIKGKTGEGSGQIGEGKLAEATVVVLLARSST